MNSDAASNVGLAPTLPMSDLKNRYAGKDVWIIASGASMGFVDPEFFANKITLGVNLAYRQFPCELVYSQDLKQEHYEELGEKLVLTEHHLGLHHQHLNQFRGNKPYYRLPHSDNGSGAIDLSVIGTDEIVVGSSSLVGAIHLAGYMGAANIVLCGADYCYVGDSLQYGLYPGRDSKLDYYPGFIANVRPKVKAVIDRVRDVFGCRIYSLNPFLGLMPECCKPLKLAPDHVLLPCKMTSKRIRDKNLQFIGTETLLDRAITRIRSWFPNAEVWVATEDASVQNHTKDRGCHPYPLTQADLNDERCVSRLFNEFLQHRSATDRCLCMQLDSPFVFRRELERAILDPRPFVRSAMIGRLFFSGEDSEGWARRSQEMPERGVLTGNFMIADGGYQATPADYTTRLSAVCWLSAIEISTPTDLDQARKIGDLLPLEFFDDRDQI